jgi:hypothetical protein
MRFHVGQRVKLSNHRKARHDYIGREGTFMGYTTHPFFRHYDSLVLYDGDADVLVGPSETLIPLTDPDSEWADEAVKSLLRKAKTQTITLDKEQLAEIHGGRT